MAQNPQGKNNISVVLAVYNEERMLGDCLDAVSDWAGEIVIVDGGSQDRTVEIAKKYGARVIESDNPPIFHINKQKALDAAKFEWVLQLDADEIVSPELKTEILRIIHEPQTGPESDVMGYFIPRRNIMWGRWIKKGGQYPDYVIRLVRKRAAKFPCQSVHEQIRINGHTGYLIHPLIHYPYRSDADYWRKAASYTDLTATNMSTIKTPRNFMSFLKYMLIKPVTTFLLIYVRHKGFLDGYPGLKFALYSACHWPIAYRKFLKRHRPSN